MSEDLIGSLIADRYSIERELARGGFGAVYLAHDRQLRDRPVVVKVLLERGVGDEWFQRKFSQEIDALARIHHPGVVAVVDAGILTDGRPFMVQQFVEGQTLREVAGAGRMDTVRVANIVRRMAQALAAAHDKGVLHRDLKPDNVLVHKTAGGEEHVILIDFGIASIADRETGEHEKTKVAGTFTYMAPEQFEGRPVAASDTYALATIAFELLAGAPPSAGKPMFELIMMQKNGTWPKLTEVRSDVSEQAQAAIFTALRYAPADRQPTALAFGEELAEALLAPVTVSTPVEPVAPVTLVAESAPPNRAWRRWFWVAAGLAAVAAMAIWLRNDLDKPPVASPAPAVATAPQLAYWLNVVRYRNGQYGEPFVLSREAVFQHRDRIYFEFEASGSGWLYLINQAPRLDGGLPVYVKLFPTATTNGGRATLGPKSPVRVPSEFFEFDSDQGVELLWIVWAAEPVAALASIASDQPKLPERDRRSILDFLRGNEPQRPIVRTDEALMRTFLEPKSAIAIHKIELYSR